VSGLALLRSQGIAGATRPARRPPAARPLAESPEGTKLIGHRRQSSAQPPMVMRVVSPVHQRSILTAPVWRPKVKERTDEVLTWWFASTNGMAVIGSHAFRASGEEGRRNSRWKMIPTRRPALVSP
jgi:hypothetical protein